MVGFARIDSLEDAEATEVLEGKLEFFEGLGSGDKLFDGPLGSLFDYFAHN